MIQTENHKGLKIKTQETTEELINQFIEAFQNLDIVALEKLTDAEDISYDYFKNKKDYLTYYKAIFDKYLNRFGSTEVPLKSVEANCMECLYNHPNNNAKVYSFFENKTYTSNVLNIVFFKHPNGGLLDVYECESAKNKKYY